jgi:hypothetical protein
VPHVIRVPLLNHTGQQLQAGHRSSGYATIKPSRWVLFILRRMNANTPMMAIAMVTHFMDTSLPSGRDNTLSSCHSHFEKSCRNPALFLK